MKFILALGVSLVVLTAPQGVAAQPAAGQLVTPPLRGEPQPPPDPAAIGYARQIIDALLPPERRVQMNAGVTGTVINQIGVAAMGGSTDAGLHEVVAAKLAELPKQLAPVGDRNIPLIVDAMVRVYAREFSLAELEQIAGFARTPAGAHYFSQSMTLLTDPSVTAANQAYFREAANVAQAGLPQLRAAVTEYLIKHPELARDIQARQRGQGRPKP